MPKLPRQDQICVKDLLGMNGGYVMDLSNRELTDLVRDELEMEIDDPRYESAGTSKAKRLMTLLDESDAATAARLLRALWDHREQRQWTPNDMVEERPSQVRTRFMAVVERLDRLAGASDTSALGGFDGGATLEELVAAIGRDASAGAHAAALDRLHTYCCKRFADLLAKEGLPCTREEPLHSRAGKFVKHLGAIRQLRPITSQILKNSVGVLQAYNDVRNNASLAHDNELVEAKEAKLIMDSVLATMRFIDDIASSHGEYWRDA